jgi:hypothetical protein
MPTSHKKRRWKPKASVLKKYNIELSDGFLIVAEYQWVPGKMTDFALILIRPKEQRDGFHMICRYDTAHDFAHLDLLDSEGKVMEKMAVPGITSYKAAFTYAQDDLKKNHQWYWQKYLEASPEERP